MMMFYMMTRVSIKSHSSIPHTRTRLCTSAGGNRYYVHPEQVFSIDTQVQLFDFILID